MIADQMIQLGAVKWFNNIVGLTISYGSTAKFGLAYE